MTLPVWTADLVGQALVDALKRLPGRPVMSSARGFTADGVEVEPFGWPERFVVDIRDRRILTTWASCLASGQSIRERYRDLGWSRSGPERRRRVALAAIAAGLNEAKLALADHNSPRSAEGTPKEQP